MLLHICFGHIIIFSFYCRETGSIEKHADALVALLESCLCHSLAPSVKGEDPPHTKIASDVLSCIFLVCIHFKY